MADRIEYRRWWMTNTTTRNAFYQVFDIVRRSAGGHVIGHAVVTHYGSLKIAEGDFSRPVIGGTVKAKEAVLDSTEAAARQAVFAKQKNDYVVKVADAVSLPATPGWITRHFGATVGRDVELALGIIEPISDIDTPIVREDDALIDRGEVWGSW